AEPAAEEVPAGAAAGRIPCLGGPDPQGAANRSYSLQTELLRREYHRGQTRKRPRGSEDPRGRFRFLQPQSARPRELAPSALASISCVCATARQPQSLRESEQARSPLSSISCTYRA